MIDTCQKCGGLYATENGEMFAGTPCKCPSQTPRTPKPPPAVICSEWMDALRKELRADAMRMCEKAQAGKGLEAMADMAVALAVTRIADCVERTLKSASIDVRSAISTGTEDVE